MQGTHATGRSDSGNRGHASPGKSHVGQGETTHGDSDCRDAPHTEPLTRCEDTQAGHSRDATAMATAFEPLNRSLETFLTRLSRTNERSEKSRRVFKKPRCYKDESDGCIDTWIEVMKLHFEEEDLSERQECSALTSILEGTALNCVMAKKQYQRDTAEKIFEILLNRFGSGVQGHQAMMRFEKRRQREDETIDKFLDDLEMLRRRSQPDESNRRMNRAVASKFIDGVKIDELRTMLATHYTPLSTNAPTPEELRLKSKEYLLLKPPSRSGYYKNNYGNFNNGPANQGNNWYKPRDDMDKRRSSANCSSTDHHVSACPTYKQGMKAIGFSLEDEDASELDHEDFMRGVIARLASESTPVEQGHYFATSTGKLDREEMSELSDISTEIAATRRSPTDNTMMAGGTEKQTTSSSFSERMRNTLGNIFPFTMGGGAGNEGESQEEEDKEEQVEFGSQVSLNSSSQENEAYVGRETGTMDKLGVVRTISKEVNTPGQSRDFAIMTNSELQTGESRNRGLGNALADPEVDNEKTSRQRVKARISTSTKLPGTDRVTPPLVTPLVDNGAALEEALNNIVDSLGEQNEQMSIRMSELERAVHIERESLREEINRNRQEVGRSEKRLKERTDEHMAKNLSRMTREAEQRELRLRDDMEKLRIQQEQSLGTLDTKIDAMMER